MKKLGYPIQSTVQKMHSEVLEDSGTVLENANNPQIFS